MKDQVEVHVEELRNTLMTASMNYDIWWIYKEKESRRRYLDILNQYPDFFATSIHAHFVALVVALYRLFEQRQDTIHIGGLLDLVRSKNLLEVDNIREIKEKRNRAMVLWKKITMIRSNLFAHRSNKLSVDEILSKAKVTPNEIKELIDVTEDILNAIGPVA